MSEMVERVAKEIYKTLRADEWFDHMPKSIKDDYHAAARAAIAAMREDLENVLIGGNHLALLIGADHPRHTATHDEALEHYKAGDQYEIWCAWRSIMHLSRNLDAAIETRTEIRTDENTEWAK